MLPNLSTRPTAPELGRALLQLVWTTAIVVAPPILLARWAPNPIPAQMPDWANVMATPTQLIEPAVIVNVLIAAVWIAWAVVVAYIVVDLVVIARGATRRVGRMGPLGIPAAKLIAAIVVIAALLRSPTTASATPTRSAASVSYVIEHAPPAPAAAPTQGGAHRATAHRGGSTATATRTAARPAATAAGAGAHPKYRVQKGDTLWDIAGRTLGDPFRWPEIDKLNPQLGKTHVIQPGMILTLPLDAHVTTAAPAQPVTHPAPVAAPAPPAAPPAPAIAVPDPDPARPAAPAVSTPPVATSAPVTPVPAAPAPAPDRGPSTPTTWGTATAGRGLPLAAVARGFTNEQDYDRFLADQPPRVAPPQAADDLISTPVGPIGLAGPVAGLTAVAVGATLRRRRQRVLARRPTGAPLPVRDDTLRSTETALARRTTTEAESQIRWVDATLRMLGHHRGSTGAAPVLVRPMPAGGTEVLWNRDPGPAAVGFVGTQDNAHTWLTEDDDLTGFEQSAQPLAVAAPVTVSVGVLPEGPILANLAALSPLSLAGNAEMIAAWLASVDIELAAYPWSRAVHFSGLAEPGAAAVVRVVVEPDVGRVTVEVRAGGPVDGWYLGFGAGQVRLCSPSRDLDLTMTAVGLGPTDAERLQRLLDEAAEDPYTTPLTLVPDRTALHPAGPPVVAHAADVAAGAGIELPTPPQLDTAHRPAPVAATTAAGIAAAAGIELPNPPPLGDTNDNTGSVAPATAAVVERPAPRRLEPPRVADVDEDEWVAPADSAARLEEDELVAETSAESAGDAKPAPVGGSDEPRAGRPMLSEPESWSPRVALRVLGPVAVAGAAERVRPKPLELLTLVMLGRPAPVRRAEVLDKMWDHDPSPRLMSNVISRLRVELGDKDLITNQGGVVSVSDIVESDWARFEDQVRRARDNPAGPARLGLYRDALALVTGPPLSELPPGVFGWLDGSGLRSRMEIAIGDTADQLAVQAIDAGDTHLALWAVGQGLKGCPYHVRLYTHSLAAYAAANDRNGFEATMRDAKARAEWLEDELPVDVIETYQALGRHFVAR